MAAIPGTADSKDRWRSCLAFMPYPHTFTIDGDGVLREEKVGDASIEGKLKKLIAQAREMQQVVGSADRN